MTSRFNSSSRIAYANPDLQSQLFWRVTAQQINDMATVELARRRMIDYGMYMNPNYQVKHFHRLIAEKLDGVIRGTITRLMISMPPGHGKSEWASVNLPTMYMGLYPERKVIHSSYAASLSNDFSRKVRGIIRDSQAYKRLFPKIKLDPDRARVDDWNTIQGGNFFSVGIEGGVTGHRAHLIDIDDPLKEGDELSIPTMMDKFRWFVSAAQTRLLPGGAIVITGTRWSPYDIIGQLLEMMKHEAQAEQWEYLCLPAIAGDDDPMGRVPGEALWPEWYPLPRLHALRALDRRYFSALFQQQPTHSETQMFFEEKFILTKRTDLHHLPAIWTFDAATSEKEQADFSAMGRWRYDKASGDLVVSNARRMQKGWPYVKKLIKRLIRLYPNDKFVFPPDLIELLAVQDLRAEMPQDRARIVSIERADYKGDKMQRAQTYADRAANGKAYVEPSRHAKRFIAEHAEFPGAHDDFVDVSSVATHYFRLHEEFMALIAARQEVVDMPGELAELMTDL